MTFEAEFNNGLEAMNRFIQYALEHLEPTDEAVAEVERLSEALERAQVAGMLRLAGLDE